MGNLVSTTDPRGKVWTFTYDNRHRRIVPTDPLGHITRWTYHADGNSLTETCPDGGVTTNTYDAMNRVLTTHDWSNETTTFAYGGKGGTGAARNQGDNLITLTDARGSSYAFTYDAKNRVIARTINATTTLYIFDDWNLIDERNAADTQQAKYIHGPAIDEMLVRTTYDICGTPTFLDATGTAVPSSPTSKRYLFTGREYLAELAIYDYRNRVYQAELGRFLQTDPILFDARDANIYRYVLNAPTDWIDPEGLIMFPPPGPAPRGTKMACSWPQYGLNHACVVSDSMIKPVPPNKQAAFEACRKVANRVFYQACCIFDVAGMNRACDLLWACYGLRPPPKLLTSPPGPHPPRKPRWPPTGP